MSREIGKGRERPTFTFSGQAFSGSVPINEPVMLVLDTNVVSAIDEVAKRGMNLELARHRRVLHLVQWMRRRPDSGAFALFGAVEGAGFHAGGISARNFLARSMSVDGLLKWAMRSPAALSSGVPIPSSAFRMPTEADCTTAVTRLEGLLPLTVLTGYVTSLAIARASQLDLAPLDGVRWVHDRLARDLDFIPAYALLPTLLVFCGRPQDANKLRTGLFKLASRNLRTALLSAGWDLGYLQLLSLARTPALSPLFEGLCPILVTEEQRLPELAALVTAEGNTGAFEIAEDMFDPKLAAPAYDLAVELVARRASAILDFPTWDTARRAAERLEAELGFTEAPALRLVPPKRVLSFTAEDLESFLAVLRFEGQSEAIEQLSAANADVFVGGLVVLATALTENATIRQRDLDGTWQIVDQRLPEGWSDFEPLKHAAVAVDSYARDDTFRFNAVLERMHMSPDSFGFMLIALWHLGRIIIGDTATARGIAFEEVFAGFYE